MEIFKERKEHMGHDLDEFELRATRMMNGADKENVNLSFWIFREMNKKCGVENNKDIKDVITNLKRYIDSDEIYTRYKNGEYTEISDFEMFCINHCKDIEIVLGNLDALCDMQRTADIELKNTRQINEEHQKINAELRKKVKELETKNKSYNIAYDLGKAFLNKKWEQKIKDKIEELNNQEQELQNSITEEEREEYSDANISFQLCDIEIRKEVLEELLQEEDK